MIELDHPVVGVRLGPQTNLLKHDRVTLRSGLELFLALVKVLAVIHDPANRRAFGRRNFYEIQTGLACEGQSLMRRNDSELLLMLIDDPDRSNPDPLIQAK